MSVSERDKSLGDPRGVVWSSDGTRGYVTGMGSGNLIIVDTSGNRVGRQSVLLLGDRPTGLALDEPRKRLYVLNRFAAAVAAVDTEAEVVVTNVPLYDPTPSVVKTGRKHLYDTHKPTSRWPATLPWDAAHGAREKHFRAAMPGVAWIAFAWRAATAARTVTRSPRAWVRT